MPDVDGLGATDSGSSRQRLVDVTVEMKPRLVTFDELHDRVRSHLESSSNDVVVQQRVVRRNVREQHINGAEGVELRCILGRINLIGSAHRTDQPSADESPSLTVDVDHVTVDDAMSFARILRPQGRNIDVTEGHECR